tara:strand:+ start:299 stop:487 length:189 start_codon:yes stop_codon:yes gene_type:complete
MKVHRSSQELQDTIEGYKELVKMQRQEIQDLKKYQAEVIRLENLLHGYKKVIEDISKSGSKT